MKKLRKRLRGIKKMSIFATSLVSPWGKAGGLIYDKDVFERLSLCIKNLANS